MNLTLTPLAPDATPIILHIEHTGGTTLLHVVFRQYRPDELFQIYQFRSRPTTRYINMPVEQRQRYKAIIGHLFYGLHRHVPGPSRYVTIMRQPIDRIISSYTYSARKARVKDYQAYAAGEVSWQKHLADRPAGVRQITRIAGGDDALIQLRRAPEIPDDIVDTAIRNIETDFALVGLQERFDESLLMMRHVLNWTQPIYYVRQNTTTKRVRLADLVPADRALIEEAAAIEIPLYEYAKKQFDAQISAYPGDIEREVALFRAENEKYAATQVRLDRFKAPIRAIRRAISRALGAPRKR